MPSVRSVTFTAAVVAAVGVSATPFMASSLHQASNSGLSAAATCATGVQSCTTEASGNTCCYPVNGVYVLAMQWLPSYCKTSTCANQPLREWTLHGLWPDNCEGKMVSTCTDATYNNVGDLIKKTDPALFDSMDRLWPSYFGDNNQFWVHEWNKHGTCWSPADTKCFDKSTFAPGQDVVKYFKAAMNMREQYNLETAFAAAGVDATKTSSVPLASLRSAISQTFNGAKSSFICKGQYLVEVRVSGIADGEKMASKSDLISIANEITPESLQLSDEWSFTDADLANSTDTFETMRRGRGRPTRGGGGGGGGSGCPATVILA